MPFVSRSFVPKKKTGKGENKMDVVLSFLGLGIENFEVDPVIFSVGPISVRWYGLIITLGMVAAVLYTIYRGKQNGVSLDDVLDIALIIIPAGIIGARLYYVLTTLGSRDYSSFLDVIAIWNGGLAIYGGVIGGAVALYFVARYKKKNPFTVMDCVIPGVMLAQAMGRWGNFFNGEAFGAVVAESSPLYFLRMGVISPMSREIFGDNLMHYVHPTFFYESLWNVVGFVLINVFYKKKKFEGEILCWYAVWYGFGRMFIEGLRMDSLMVGPFRISQVIGLLCFLVGVFLIVYFRFKAARKANSTENV